MRAPSPSPTAEPARDAADFQAELWTWVQQTFPDETAGGVLAHLKEEIAELEQAPSDPKEMADCFLLLQCLASHYGVNLLEAARAKFEECKGRTWEKTERGYRSRKQPNSWPSTPFTRFDAKGIYQP